MSDIIPITRTLIFDGYSHSYNWASDMLTAIATSRALGVPQFDIEVTEDQREVPVYTQRQDWSGLSQGVVTGTRMEQTRRVRVYAVRVEDR